VPNVLLVDDDAELACMLADTLGARTFCLWHATTAVEAEVVLDQRVPDLILLDLMLPDRSGLVLCADLKARLDVPVIICSGTRRKDDATLGLALGAADFVAKPFSLDELRVRMQAALHQAGTPSRIADPSTNDVQQFGALLINRAECLVSLAGQVLDLTPTEYRLLCAIASRPNQVVSREELADGTWGAHDVPILESLSVHMRHLRSKLQTAAQPAPRVITRRGFGYQLSEQ
jgi:DNA-binding response OmpR family regulator